MVLAHCSAVTEGRRRKGSGETWALLAEWVFTRQRRWESSDPQDVGCGEAEGHGPGRALLLRQLGGPLPDYISKCPQDAEEGLMQTWEVGGAAGDSLGAQAWQLQGWRAGGTLPISGGISREAQPGWGRKQVSGAWGLDGRGVCASRVLL